MPFAWSYAQIVVLLLFIAAALILIIRGNLAPEPLRGSQTTLPPEIAPMSTPRSALAETLESMVTTSPATPPATSPTGTHTDTSRIDSTPITNNPSTFIGAVSTLVPTNQPREQQLVIDGLRSYRAGDYDAAQVWLESVVVSGVGDPATYLSAHFHLARTYLANGQTQSALDTLGKLDKVLNSPEGQGYAGRPVLHNMAYFLRAKAYAQQGQYSLAIAAYEQFLEAYPWMAESIYPKIGQAYLNLGNSTNAAAAYIMAAEVAAQTEDRVAYVLLLETVAQIYNNIGQYEQTVAAYDRILAVAKNSHYRTEIQFRAGQTLALAGNQQGALDRWYAATQESTDGAYAHSALVELVHNQVEFDLYRRGIINLEAGMWWPAFQAFEGFLTSAAPDDARRGRAMHSLGQAYMGLDNYAAANTAFDKVLEEYPTCSCIGQVWLDRANMLVSQGDITAAKRTYRRFALEFPQEPLAGELALADAFPESKRAPDALYALGLGGLENGFYNEAIQMYQRLLEYYPDYKSEAVHYWGGRAYYAAEKMPQAKEIWQQLVDSAPDVYYGVLAAYALQNSNHSALLTDGYVLERISDVSGPPSTLDGDDGSQQFAEQWLRSWLKTDIATTDLLNDPHFKIGEMLLELGQRGEGLEMLERTYATHKDDRQMLYTLSLEFERLGANRLSLIAMTRLISFSPANLVEDAPIFLQKRSYPQPFAELITEGAQERQINPLLYFSLVRQESLFDEGAYSVAAAQGLAQIIPDTGDWVAQQLAYPDYHNELLYRPYVNLKFGAYYLHWTRGYLKGNSVSALVGYNAGPGNSQLWRRLSGADDTFFVETLPVSESQIYVKQIVTNLYHYTRLYGGR